MVKEYGITYKDPYVFAVDNIGEIIRLLNEAYPFALTTSLDFSNPFELLISTILAAQCTDKLVNKVTPALFQKYKSPQEFVDADLMELQDYIRQTGFFRNKSIAIMKCSKDIIEKFEGKVPENVDELVMLHGVGRKTANVVIANAFGKQGIIVDTHMLRITKLLGLTVNNNPDKIELDLRKIVPEDSWTNFSHKILEHGRSICIARRPKCEICPVSDYCRYYKPDGC